MKAILGNIEGYKVNDSFKFMMGEISPYAEPFYFKSNNGQAQEITIKMNKRGSPVVTLQYSTDGENWSNAPSITTTGITLQVPATGKLYMRATAKMSGMVTGWGYYDYNYYNYIRGGESLSVGGNLLSLVTGSNFNGQKSYSLGKYAFYNLMNSMGITDASKLLFPTNVDENWYGSMLANTQITTAPALPATTLASGCYTEMFSNCKSLITPPELPATTLASSCYKGMFYNCTSMTAAPALPATTLASGCYEEMFKYCYALTAAPELPATNLASYCYRNMFFGCKFTTPPALPATKLANYCYAFMFYICNNLTKAPELPATTLVRNCYESMFRSCTSLNEVKCHATDISASSCISNWMMGVPNTGVFYKDANTTYPSGNSGIPSGWTVVDL